MAAICFALLWLCWAGWAQERKVDPTWLRRHVPAVAFQPSEFTTPTSRYKPVFGAGDRDARVCRTVSRFGELVVETGGATATLRFAREEHAWVIQQGSGELEYGDRKVPFRAQDYFYVPPDVSHRMRCAAGPCRIVVMGFRTPVAAPAPSELLLANLAEVPKQVVGGHPPSVLYQLLMGDRRSTRDRLAAGLSLTSLFTMEFEPGGTNFPHHHEREEEIYLVLEGRGQMVAGGGMDGVEGRHPTEAGDAWFFRVNCTVGFYAGNRPGEPKSRILAVRALAPWAPR